MATADALQSPASCGILLYVQVTDSVSAAVFEKLNPWFRHGAEEESTLFTDSARGGLRPVHPFNKHTGHLGVAVFSPLSAELNPDSPGPAVGCNGCGKSGEGQ